MGISRPEDNKKKQLILFVGVIVGLVAVLVFGLWLSDPNKGEKSVVEKAREEEKVFVKNFGSKPQVSSKDLWVAKSEERLKNQSDKSKALESRSDRLEGEVAALKTLIKKMQDEEGERIAAPASGVEGNTALPPGPRNVGPDQAGVIFPPSPMQGDKGISQDKIVNTMVPPTPGSEKGQANGTMFHLSLSDEGEDGEDETPKNAEHFIPAGSFSTAIMLAGVDAPTGGLAQTNPSPVLFRLKEDARLPNFWRSEIQDCHVIGEAVGNMSSERAEIRLNKMSCVLSTGEVIEKKVKGWVTGEDGKAGVRGKVISKQGRLIAMSAFAGIFGGIGESVSQQNQIVQSTALGTVTTIDPKQALESGLATGFADSMQSIQQYYMERANETYPVIEVSAKRVVELVLSEGIDLGDVTINNNTRSAYNQY